MIKSWEDVNLGKWQKLQSIDESLPDISKLIEQISILEELDSEEIRALNIADFNKLVSELNFLSREIKSDIELKFTLNGVKYGMIPDFNFITTGEFIDIEMFKRDTVANIHLICALLWRPIVSENDDEWEIQPHISKGFNKRANLFLRELPITTALGGVLFFSNLGIQYTKTILDYLENQ